MLWKPKLEARHEEKPGKVYCEQMPLVGLRSLGNLSDNTDMNIRGVLLKGQ